MTNITLNKYIEWTYEDQCIGECPVPDGTSVTLWFKSGEAQRTIKASVFTWDGCYKPPYFDRHMVVGYLVHSAPREPIVRWFIVGGKSWRFDTKVYHSRRDAEIAAAEQGVGYPIVKLVETRND